MTVSSKGQITLPMSIRRSWGLKPGDKVSISDLGEKGILKKASSGDIFSLVGRFKKHGAKPLSKSEQETLVSQAAYDEYMRKVREGRA